MKLRILPAWCLILLSAQAIHGDEFQTLSDSFGTTLTLAGVPHATVTNPDGSAINFWTNSFEGAPATTVGLSNPHMAAADAYGNVFIADKASNSILKISPDGLLHTFAGTHANGFNGDGPAPATSLRVDNPNGLFVFPNGVVYLLDPGNHRIRRVGTNGIMTTVVNDTDPRWASTGRALWVSPDEKLIYYTHELSPIAPSTITDGAVVKKWTATNGIETVCGKSVGFRNPGNIAVNPADGKLYVTDRAEDDATLAAMGLFRIDGVDKRTRMTGDFNLPVAADGALAINAFISQPRGIAFLPDGSYFICGHKDGPIWFVDTQGVLHNYITGSGRRDGYTLTDGLHPPLNSRTYFAQARSITLAPNGNLIVVCNDSGYVFRVNEVTSAGVPTNVALLNLRAQGARLNWLGLFGRGYRIERSLSISPAAWTALGVMGASSNGIVTFTDLVPATDPQRFYRILPSL